MQKDAFKEYVISFSVRQICFCCALKEKGKVNMQKLYLGLSSHFKSTLVCVFYLLKYSLLGQHACDNLTK